jgi:hypothetical protein
MPNNRQLAGEFALKHSSITLADGPSAVFVVSGQTCRVEYVYRDGTDMAAFTGMTPQQLEATDYDAIVLTIVVPKERDEGNVHSEIS